MPIVLPTIMADAAYHAGRYIGGQVGDVVAYGGMQDPTPPPSPSAPQTYDELTTPNLWNLNTLFNRTAQNFIATRGSAIPDPPPSVSSLASLFDFKVSTSMLVTIGVIGLGGVWLLSRR